MKHLGFSNIYDFQAACDAFCSQQGTFDHSTIGMFFENCGMNRMVDGDPNDLTFNLA